jgi:hypothetical protein
MVRNKPTTAFSTFTGPKKLLIELSGKDSLSRLDDANFNPHLVPGSV